MMQQKNIVKGNALRKIGRVGLISAAILIVMIGFLVLPTDDPNNYVSPPNPAANYSEAVQRVERMRAAEVGFNPDCHTVLLTHGARTAEVIASNPPRAAFE